MRRFFFVLCLLLLAREASAVAIKRFTMGVDRLEARLYRGGKLPCWVKRTNGADFAVVASFFGYKTFPFGKVRCAVDLVIENGQIKIANQFHRKILASYADGTLRIFRNWAEMKPWGMPESAVAGMAAPPDPNRKLWRQFWAIKGRHYYWVKFRGTRLTGEWLVRQWGFESIVYMDGGSSLAPNVLHPAFILVFKNAFEAVQAGRR